MGGRGDGDDGIADGSGGDRGGGGYGDDGGWGGGNDGGGGNRGGGGGGDSGGGGAGGGGGSGDGGWRLRNLFMMTVALMVVVVVVVVSVLRRFTRMKQGSGFYLIRGGLSLLVSLYCDYEKDGKGDDEAQCFTSDAMNRTGNSSSRQRELQGPLLPKQAYILNIRVCNSPTHRLSIAPA